jgi:hypothetical protein
MLFRLAQGVNVRQRNGVDGSVVLKTKNPAEAGFFYKESKII